MAPAPMLEIEPMISRGMPMKSEPRIIRSRVLKSLTSVQMVLFETVTDELREGGHVPSTFSGHDFHDF